MRKLVVLAFLLMAAPLWGAEVFVYVKDKQTNKALGGAKVEITSEVAARHDDGTSLPDGSVQLTADLAFDPWHLTASRAGYQPYSEVGIHFYGFYDEATDTAVYFIYMSAVLKP